MTMFYSTLKKVSNDFLFHKLKGSAMNNDLYHKRNERKVSFLYPKHGSKNILRSVKGVKVASFTGPNGRGITVREDSGLHKSFSLSKCVASL